MKNLEYENNLIFVLAAVFIFFAGSMYFMLNRGNSQNLLNDFNAQLKNGKFEEIYDESTDQIKYDVSKEEFVRRMSIAINKMKAIDPDLNFVRDLHADKVIGKSSPFDPIDFHGVETIGEGDKSLSVIVTWANQGFKPKFVGMSAVPGSKEVNKYRVWGVSYRTINAVETE